MQLSQFRDQIPDFGRDIRLNVESVLTGESPLSPRQTWGTALACAYALGSRELVELCGDEGGAVIDDALRTAARAAATIMAMNNVYYRSTHLMDDAALKKMPARLRMNVIGKPGIDKAEFELMSFAVSALAGCGQCLTAHLHELRKAGLSDEAVQTALRLSSVLNAAAAALKIREL